MRPAEHAALTVDRTIVPNGARPDSDAAYRRLSTAEGERHLVMDGAVPAEALEDAESLAYFAHLTDIQLADVESPGRMEMMHDRAGDPRVRSLIPAFRPQELLAAHATEMLIRAINDLAASPLSGRSMDMVLTTGDMADNAQENEVVNYLRLFAGGRYELNSFDVEQFQGVQNGRLPWVWAPEHRDSPWGRRHGFPHVPGYLQQAFRSFTATGLQVPWLACLGNHDTLVQGRTGISSELSDHQLGDHKPTTAPSGDLPDYVRDPMYFYRSPGVTVAPDAGRRYVDRRAFVERHFHDGSPPVGHGFTDENREHGTAYFAYDVNDDVRLLMLDTNNPAGNFEGSIDPAQYEWLAGMLRSSRERLVLVASHHPRSSMTNDTTGSGEEVRSRVLGAQVADLLNGFPNVVAWFSGHIHRHRVIEPGQEGNGFFEITSGAVMEWPCQFRLLELLRLPDGRLALVSTIVDHAAPSGWHGDLETMSGLAALHRELSFNDPTSVGGREARGGRRDRNAVFVFPDPR